MMDNYQWSAQWEHICSLWADWDPNDAEHRAWREALESYDLYLLDKAIKACYRKPGRYRRPDLGKLIATIKEVAKDTQAPSSENTLTHYIGFICTEAGKLPAGHYDMYCFVAQMASDRSWALPHSQIKKDLQDKYVVPLGGRWISVVSESYVDIRRQAATYRQELVKE